MMDGISAMDTGNNGQMIAMNTEAVAEVKVLTQSYQAEYGRSSGIQILSVTKSGTNQFRGSRLRHRAELGLEPELLDNNQNRRSPRRFQAARLWLLDWRPRSGSRAATTSCSSSTATRSGRARAATPEQTFRVPTALERQGDFSQSRDNLGNLYPYIRDRSRACRARPRTPRAASRTAACSGRSRRTVCMRRAWRS